MSRKLLATSLAVGAGALVLALQLESKPIYSYSVADFLARDVRDREVRVGGLLVRGSLCQVAAECGYRFAMADGVRHTNAPNGGSPATLSVSYDGCFLPDTFRDIAGLDLTVSVQGQRCQTCHDFQATQLMAKCPSKYQVPDGDAYLSASPPPRCDTLTPRM